MKIKVFLILCIVLFANISFASLYNSPTPISGFINNLPQFGDIDCKFKQEKYLADIDRTLVSGGDFHFRQNVGITFATTYPIQSVVSYQNKDYRQINDIILAISEKKYSRLERDFKFYYEQVEDRWSLGLKPQDNSKLKDFLKSITIDGKSNIEKIMIVFSNGNKTTLWFSTK